MANALENVQGGFFYTSGDIVKKGIERSRSSPRKRIILPIHRKQEASVQRMLNFLQPGTYIRPHKHSMPGATESAVILKGKICFFIFEDNGNITRSRILDESALNSVADIEPGVWHSFIVLEKDTILFECKKGPYDAETDKIFASWAPEEFTGDAGEYLKKMEACV